MKSFASQEFKDFEDEEKIHAAIERAKRTGKVQELFTHDIDTGGRFNVNIDPGAEHMVHITPAPA